MLRSILAAGLALGWAGAGLVSAVAAKLPPGAVPLTADAVTKLHSGNSGLYPTVDEYFAPDGTTIGTFGKPVVKSTFAGKWVVMGNTLCTLNGSSYDAKIYTDCNAFWRACQTVLFLWATHSDGSKVDSLNGFYDAGSALKPGNLVAEKYKAAGGL